MQLVDRHVIRKTHFLWAEIDDLAFRSKNLYNLANYHVRQSFVFQGQTETRHQLNQNWAAAIDVGIDNLAALTSNKPGFIPMLVNGRSVKAIKQFYNKRKAQLQFILGSDQATSHRIRALSTNAKSNPDTAFGLGIEGVVVRPVGVTAYQQAA